MQHGHRLLGAIVIGAFLLSSSGSGNAPAHVQATPSFASQIADLSEPAGYFDTDNLISNERSYLQVIPDLKRRSVRGGAYIGVGPDQNYTYIAAVRPAIAFIIDVRRDNMLLHLLFKSLFSLSRTRVEYLALLLGRTVPPDLNGWREAPIDRLVKYIEGTPRDVKSLAALRYTRRCHGDANWYSAVGRRSRHDRSVPPSVHRRRARVALSLHGPRTPIPLPDVWRVAAGDRPAWRSRELPGVRGSLPVPQVAACARPHHSGRWRSERSAGARRRSEAH